MSAQLTLRSKTVFVLVLLGCAFNSPAASLAPADQAATRAEALLTSVALDLARFKTLHVEIASTQTLRSGEKIEVTTSSAKAWYQKPRRLLYVSHGPSWATVSHTNGTSRTIYRPALNRYTATRLESDPDAHLEPIETQFGPLVATLFSADPKLPYDSAIYAGETSASTAHRIRARWNAISYDLILPAQGPILPLWMDIETAMPAADGSTSGAIRRRNEIAFAWDTRLNLHESTFEFRPPPGAALVESFSELMTGTEQIAVGARAPLFSLPARGGGKINLSDLLGKKIVVLDFWASWCKGCPQSLAHLQQIAEEYQQDAVFVAINVKEDPQAVDAFLREHNLTLNVAFDADGSVATAYQARRIPQTIIVGRDGTVKAVHIGLSPDSGDVLKDDLEKIIRAPDAMQGSE